MDAHTFRERLEKHNNPEEVRQRLAAGNYNQQNARVAQEYLDSIDRVAAAEAAMKRDAREEETLALAREANEISRAASFAATAAAASAAESNAISRFNRKVGIASVFVAVIAAIAAIVAAYAAMKSMK